MADKTKVIRGLTGCLKDHMVGCEECPYYADMVVHGNCREWMMRDTLDLLKELMQQPHSKTFTVIDRKTGKEADEYNIALREEWAKRLVYCDMDGFALLQDGTLLLCDECGNAVVCDPERFEVVWDE